MSTTITNSVYDMYSIENQTSSDESGNDANKTDFLTLLTAQMQNQDPSNPADSGEFMSQIAQFSQVTSLENLQTSFDNFTTEMLSTQTLQATSLIGKSIMAAGDSVDLEEGNNVSASLEMSAPATDVVVNITDATGVLIDRVNLGDVDTGVYNFEWDGIDSSGAQASSGTYYLQAEGTNTSGETVALTTLTQDKVSSVSLANSNVVLNTASGKAISLQDVQQIM